MGDSLARLSARMPRRVVIVRALIVWVFLVTLYFLWEASAYRGLYALLSEWQFDWFGHYLPILTFAFLVVLFGSPAAWLLRSPRDSGAPIAPDEFGGSAAISTSMNFRRTLLGFAGGLAAAALACLLWTLTLPHMSRPTRLIAAEAPAAQPLPRGPALLRGEILYTRTSAFTQDLLFTRRGVRFAPLVAPGRQDRSIRYFVELPPSIHDAQLPADLISTRAGILMRGGLPGSILRLYHYAGYRIEQPYYVLFASTLTMRWPYYVTAAQLAIAALAVLLAALVQHRHILRLTRAKEAAKASG
jgi:hypothetical protein